MILLEGSRVRDAFIEGDPLVLHGIQIPSCKRVKDHSTGYRNARSCCQLAGGTRLKHPRRTSLVLGVSCTVKHVRLSRSLDVTKQLSGLFGGIYVRLRVVRQTGHITVENDLKVCISRSWVLICGLKAVVWHLVILHANVNSSISGFRARHTQFAGESARV